MNPSMMLKVRFPVERTRRRNYGTTRRITYDDLYYYPVLGHISFYDAMTVNKWMDQNGIKRELVPYSPIANTEAVNNLVFTAMMEVKE